MFVCLISILQKRLKLRVDNLKESTKTILGTKISELGTLIVLASLKFGSPSKNKKWAPKILFTNYNLITKGPKLPWPSTTQGMQALSYGTIF